MKNKYVDEYRAGREWSAVEKSCNQAQAVFEAIAEKGIIPSRSDIDGLVGRNNTFSLAKRYKEQEYDKLKPFIAQYGSTPLTDGVGDKIEQMTLTFKRELLSYRENVNYYALDWFDYLEFTETGVSIKPQYTLEYFQMKYTVNFTGTKHHEFYKKHVECCRLLNELSDKPDNEFAALDKLFWFNPESKEFELNILAYYPAVFEKEDSGLTEFLK